jgi:hypothetical protein
MGAFAQLSPVRLVDHAPVTAYGSGASRSVLTPALGGELELQIISGRWTSAYDGVTTTVADALQIGHVVPLAEAWASGASAWPEARRVAYGNDLTDHRTLREVTVHANETKGDRDPAPWLPPLVSDQCSYVADWISIKERWGLTMDPAESSKLHAMLAGQCKGSAIAP